LENELQRQTAIVEDAREERRLAFKRAKRAK
jgi:hypothetical protein